jgi:carbon storage regulator
MNEHDRRLLEAVERAAGEQILARHPDYRPGPACLPRPILDPAFRGRGWTDDERAHLLDCPRCRRLLGLIDPRGVEELRPDRQTAKPRGKPRGGMLVLTRKMGESIVIGEGKGAINVSVVACGKGRVRLGIAAPQDVVIRREELCSHVQEVNAEAGSAPPPARPSDELAGLD